MILTTTELESNNKFNTKFNTKYRDSLEYVLNSYDIDDSYYNIRLYSRTRTYYGLLLLFILYVNYVFRVFV